MPGRSGGRGQGPLQGDGGRDRRLPSIHPFVHSMAALKDARIFPGSAFWSLNPCAPWVCPCLGAKALLLARDPAGVGLSFPGSLGRCAGWACRSAPGAITGATPDPCGTCHPECDLESHSPSFNSRGLARARAKDRDLISLWEPPPGPCCGSRPSSPHLLGQSADLGAHVCSSEWLHSLLTSALWPEQRAWGTISHTVPRPKRQGLPVACDSSPSPSTLQCVTPTSLPACRLCPPPPDCLRC